MKIKRISNDIQALKTLCRSASDAEAKILSINGDNRYKNGNYPASSILLLVSLNIQKDDVVELSSAIEIDTKYWEAVK